MQVLVKHQNQLKTLNLSGRAYELKDILIKVGTKHGTGFLTYQNTIPGTQQDLLEELALCMFQSGHRALSRQLHLVQYHPPARIMIKII